MKYYIEVRYKVAMTKEEAFNEGETNKQYEIALKMLENNKSLDEINLYTNISIEEINKLKNKIKKF